MEKEKTRGRTRRKQPSQVASFLYREGRRWFAAVLSLCLILNNMTGVTWAAQTAGEKEIWFKLTSSSLYEALQEAVRDGEKVNDHFLFEGKEKDVEAYEKLLLLDDDLYELKPEFENKDEVEDAENKKNLQLRIFASLSWEIDPEKEYQVAGDEKIIFYLSNGSETEQTAVIQVDEKTTEDITVLSKSAVVIGSENKEESLEAETEEVAETRENEGGENETGESETGESEGQAAEENSGEDVKKQGSGGNSGALSGGNGGNSENSPSGNGGNSGNSGSSTKTEISAEGGSFAGSSDEADKAEENKEDVEGEVQENPVEEMEEGQDNADNEEREDSKGSTDIQESIEHQGSEQGKAEDSNSAEEDKTNSNSPSESEKSEKPEEEGTEDKKTEGVETGNKEDKTSEKIEEDKASEKIESNKTEDEKKENVKTENTEDKKFEKSKSSKSENADSEKPEKEKTDIKNADTENRDQRKEESERIETVKSDHADKSDRTDKESSKKETSGKNASENTKAGKEEKADTGKSENDNSGKSDNSKADKSNHSDTSSDNGKEVSAGISRNTILLVTDNLEVSESKDASIADNDSTVVTASPSNTEDDEIEGELYEAVVLDEKSVVVFVATAEELGLNNAALRKASPSNAERISPAFEKEVELENVIVQVKADENVLPEGVQLQVKELKEEGEHAAQYEEAKEVLDSQGTEYDGMMALDINFLDNKGREIEPDGNVQVSIKVKKEALPEEADLESVSVQHLVEGEGEVFVEEVADSGNKTRGKVEVEAEEHVEAEFEVNSFSVFVIMWGNANEGQLIVNLNVSWVDEDGKSLLNEDKSETETIVITKTERFSLYSRFGKSIEGYEFERTKVVADQIQFDNGIPAGTLEKTIDNATEIEITKLNEPWYPYQIIVYPEIKEGTESIPISFRMPITKNVEVKLHYKKAENIPARLKIINEIETTGLLKVEPLDGETEAEGAKYAWFKQVNGIWQRIERQKISGDLYNIPDEAGKSINVALDKGARCYYKAELLDDEGKETGIKSESFLVEYYDELQDGSFEDVKIPNSWSESGTGEGGKWAQLNDSNEKFKWKSTTGCIELVNGTSYQHQPGDEALSEYPKGAYDGEQFAELNPQTDGALYQDVLTVPGATLNWELYHKARDPRSVTGINLGDKVVNTGSADTMYLLIMPKQFAVDITSQSQVLEVIHNYQNYPGAYVVKCTTALKEGWKRYGSSYIVGDNQYITRFFFVAGPTISGSTSVGNFLDKVWFSSELPPPAEGCGSLVINKTVSGLSQEEAEKYRILLTLRKDEDEKTFTLSGFSKNYQNGAYTDSIAFDDLKPGTYTITESVPDELSQSLGKIHGQVQSYVTVNKESAREGSSAEIEIIEGGNASVNFNNAYLLPGGSFTVKKIFKNGKNFEPAKFTNVKFKLKPEPEKEKIGEVENSENKEVGVLNGEIIYEDDDAIAKFEFSSILTGIYKLEEVGTPAGYQALTKDITIKVGVVDGVFGCYLKKDDGSWKSIASMGGIVEVVNEEKEEIPGAILPDTGGPGLAMFERYGWFLLMLALLMAGVEVRCYGERKYRRASVTLNEEFDDPL